MAIYKVEREDKVDYDAVVVRASSSAEAMQQAVKFSSHCFDPQYCTVTKVEAEGESAIILGSFNEG